MENQPARRPVTKKIVIFTVIIIVVCSVLSLFLFSEELNLDGVRRWGKYLNVRNSETFGRYSFDAHSSNSYENFGDGLAIASIGGLSTYDDSGNEQFVLQQQIELPQLLVADDMAVAYDVGGTSLIALHEKEGEVLRLEETHPILDADLSESGSICISSSSSGYKSVLSVYNEEQDLIYRWLSSSVYYPLCALSSDGRDLAAIAVGQTDGEFESSICLFKTNSEEVEKKISLGGELIYDLLFTKENNLCAIGETCVQFVSMDAEMIGTYQYKDSYLKDFDCGGDGFLVLSTNMYRAGNRYSLVTIDDRGKEIASRYLGQEVLDMSACGRYIAVLTQGKLTIYTQSLSVYHETSDISDATAVVMREDGSAVLLGGGSGELYIP